MNWSRIPPFSAISMEFAIIAAQSFMLVNPSLFVVPEQVDTFRFQIITYMLLLALFKLYIKKPLFAGQGVFEGSFYFMSGLVVGTMILVGFGKIFPDDFAALQMASPLFLLISTAIIIASSEELIFRGYAPRRLGIIPAAIFFGIMHVGIYDFSIVSVAIATVAGLVFTAIAAYTSIYAAIGAHTAWNLVVMGVITEFFPKAFEAATVVMGAG